MWASAAACAIAGALALAWRTWRFRTMSALTMRHRSLGADGIVVGGEGFTLARPGAPAVLLLHGAGDTPQTLRYLGAALHARGFHVEAPLLPGHGRTLRDFSRVHADDLTRAATSAHSALRASHDWAAIVGLSMGGALAVQVAANDGHVPALGLVAPYLSMPRSIERAERLSRIWGLVIPAVRSGDDSSIHDPAELARGLAYGVFTPAALRALRETMRRAVDALPRVTCPALMIQSREDNRISVQGAEAAFARLGARDKSLEWVSGAGHIITVDYGHDAVNARLAEFLAQHCPRAVSPAKAAVSS